MTDVDIVAFVIDRFEGHAFTDDPIDRGGPTRFGITMATLSAFLQKPATAEDVKALTHADALAVMLELYVFRPNFHQIPDWRLRLAVVDYGIHSGPTRATRALQAAVGAEEDGIFGRDTEAAVARADAGRVREQVIAARLRHIGRLITNDPKQSRFAAGWMARIATVLVKS